MSDRQRDRGQAAVEFAIVLPLLVVLVLGIIQVVLVIRDQLAVELAAREGARAASVAVTPADAAIQAARRATNLEPLDVTTSVGPRTVVVEVRHRSATDVPLLGAFVADVEVSARVTMAREPP